MIRVTFLVLVFLVGGCSKEELPAGKRAGGFQLADEKKHAQVISEMRQRGIPFIIDEKGLIQKIFTKVNTKDHTQQILNEINK
jgi:peroxiredoxin